MWRKVYKTKLSKVQKKLCLYTRYSLACSKVVILIINHFQPMFSGERMWIDGKFKSDKLPPFLLQLFARKTCLLTDFKNISLYKLCSIVSLYRILDLDESASKVSLKSCRRSRNLNRDCWYKNQRSAHVSTLVRNETNCKIGWWWEISVCTKI